MNKLSGGKYFFHIAAILTVAVWGATFASSKLLLNGGLSATEILIYRFFIAYVVIWFFSPRKLFSDSLRDELLMMVVGFTGGALYFIFENTAIETTPTTNVSLIVSTTPIWTAILQKIIYPKEKFGANLWVGTFVALAGCALVIFNGKFAFDISSPRGYILSVTAAISWAVYSLVIRNLSGRYSPMFITRKVFFWGIVTAIPFIFIPITGNGKLNLQALATPAMWGNLLFLGLVASMACFALWNVIIKKIGIVKSSNYLYLSPAFTMIVSGMMLDEKITWVGICGFVLIVSGLLLAEKGFRLGFGKKS